MRCENILPHEKNNMPHRYIKKILSANVYDLLVGILILNKKNV